MRGLIACALLFLSGTAHAQWRDWWLTREQQAQRALDAGNVEQAAELFSDPRRRAYAELEAGRYDAAAKRLAPLTDPQSQYNRGNALARAGDLRGALKAYDAALERAAAGSATERDARHNRDLVRRQLQKQEQQQQQRQDEQTPEEQAKNDESRAQQGGAGQSSAQNPAGQGSDDPAPDPSGSSDADQPAADQPAQPSGKGQPDEKEATDSREQRAEGPAVARGEDRAGEERGMSPDESPSERALAVEQWLRQIPDDPGGLLRRKFALEHRRKEREAQP